MSSLVVADPRGVYLAGLEWVLRKAGHSVVAECHHTIEVLPLVERHRPDLVIIGLDGVDRQTAGLSARLRATSSPLGIIYILQPNGGFDFNEIPKLDADGLLMDGISHSYLVECANAVAGGRKWVDDHILQHLLTPRSLPQRAPKLTGRETEVAGLVSRGLRNKIIAQRLHVSEGTVKMHLHHVYEKLRLGSRAELAWATFGEASDHLGPSHKSGL